MAEINKWVFWLARNQCLHSKDATVIASYDIWIDNRDRNYGNVVRSKDRYVAIDHESVFHDLIVKRRYQLEFAERSLLKEAAQFLKSDKLKRFQCDMAEAAGKHEKAFQKSITAIQNYVSLLVPDPSESKALSAEIEVYLDPRSKNGWMSSYLGVTV